MAIPFYPPSLPRRCATARFGRDRLCSARAACPAPAGSTPRARGRLWTGCPTGCTSGHAPGHLNASARLRRILRAGAPARSGVWGDRPVGGPCPAQAAARAMSIDPAGRPAASALRCARVRVMLGRGRESEDIPSRSSRVPPLGGEDRDQPRQPSGQDPRVCCATVGPPIYDSRVVTRFSRPPFQRRSLPPRRACGRCVTLEATADGIMEAAVGIVYETPLSAPRTCARRALDGRPMDQGRRRARHDRGAMDEATSPGRSTWDRSPVGLRAPLSRSASRRQAVGERGAPCAGRVVREGFSARPSMADDSAPE